MVDEALVESLFARYVARRERDGERLAPGELCEGDPELAAALETHIREYERLIGRQTPASPDGSGVEANLPAERPPPYRPVIDAGMLGRVVGDRYRIVEPLGAGGLGQVWRVEDLKLGVDIALKALLPEHTALPRHRELVRREVRSARQVLSAHVCRIYDLIAIDGQELVSMELIDGETLTELLRRQSPLPLEQATDLAAQLLAGLEAIHAAGLVHRDLKPDNVMVTRTGRVVVMDLGLARPISPEESQTIAGTPAYMAPEQALGRAVDARTDLYAAGIVLAEMVSPGGARSRQSREAIWEGLRSAPPKLDDSPWKAILERAVAADPSHRWESATALSRALEETTLRADPGEDRRPYPGLEPFREDRAEYFFGREAELERLWSKLQGSPARMLGLIGPSGAGKSSFLRAGLLPTRPEGWSVLITTPSRHPFQELGRALAPEIAGDAEAVGSLPRIGETEVALEVLERWRQRHGRTLLVLDQFEELFTQVEPGEAERFTELLQQAVLEADVHVLLSMRDDFLLQCHGFESLRPVFTELTPLSAPSGADLRRALVEPAHRCAYRFEDEGLASEMLAEVEGERGALPLLAFAAARLWERRDRQRGLLTRAAYEEIGGVAGALARHAESTLESIGRQRLPVVRELFRNLVTLDGTRAARQRSELLSLFSGQTSAETIESEREVASEVLGKLVNARLLTTYEIQSAGGEAPEQRIEIVHESLLLSWPRLVRWRTQDEEGAQLRDELRQAARTWDEHHRSEDRLWSGSAYRELSIWRERYPGRLTTTEDAFVEAAASLAGRRRRRRRLALSAIVAVLVATLAIVGASWRASEEARQRAEASKLVALGRLELDSDPVRSDPSTALAHAVASLERRDSTEARALALEALWAGPMAFRVGGESTALAGSPDGRRLALVTDGRPTVLPLDGGPARTLEGQPGKVTALGFDATGNRLWMLLLQPDSLDPDGQRRVGEIVLWTLAGERLATFGPLRSLGSVALTEDELLTVERADDDSGDLAIKTAPAFGGERTEMQRFPRSFRPVLSATGGRAAIAFESWVYVFEVGSDWRSGLRIGPFDRPIIAFGFQPRDELSVAEDLQGGSPTSGGLALRYTYWSLDGQGVKRLWELSPPSAYRHWPFPDYLGSSMRDGSFQLRDLVGPPDADPMVLHVGGALGFGLRGAAYDPAGSWLATTGQGPGNFVWTLRGPRHATLRGHEGVVLTVAFSPDGRWLVSGGVDGTWRRWPLSRELGREHEVLGHSKAGGWITELAFTPDGRRLLVSSNSADGLLLQDLESGEVRTLDARPGFPVAVSPDGKLVAAMPHSGTESLLLLWDLESSEGRTLRRGKESDFGQLEFRYLEFSADGRYVLSSGFRGALLWSLEDGSARDLGPGFRATMTQDGGAVYKAGRVLEGDGSMDPSGEVGRLDLRTGSHQPIPAHGDAALVLLDRSETRLVTVDWQGRIRVGPVSGEEPHLLLGHHEPVQALDISPDGRWIATGGNDGTIRLWEMPRPGTPLQALPYDQLVASLRTLTNARVVEDNSSPAGYRSEWGEFEGWTETPTWWPRPADDPKASHP